MLGAMSGKFQQFAIPCNNDKFMWINMNIPVKYFFLNVLKKMPFPQTKVMGYCRSILIRV